MRKLIVALDVGLGMLRGPDKDFTNHEKSPYALSCKFLKRLIKFVIRDRGHYELKLFRGSKGFGLNAQELLEDFNEISTNYTFKANEGTRSMLEAVRSKLSPNDVLLVLTDCSTNSYEDFPEIDCTIKFIFVEDGSTKNSKKVAHYRRYLAIHEKTKPYPKQIESLIECMNTRNFKVISQITHWDMVTTGKGVIKFGELQELIKIKNLPNPYVFGAQQIAVVGSLDAMLIARLPVVSTHEIELFKGNKQIGRYLRTKFCFDSTNDSGDVLLTLVNSLIDDLSIVLCIIDEEHYGVIVADREDDEDPDSKKNLKISMLAPLKDWPEHTLQMCNLTLEEEVEEVDAAGSGGPKLTPVHSHQYYASHQYDSGDEDDVEDEDAVLDVDVQLTDQLPSYSKSVSDWGSEEGFGYDAQRIQKALRRLPERLGMLQKEVERIRCYSIAVGNEMIALELARVLRAEGIGANVATQHYLEDAARRLEFNLLKR